jgi:hypothetical protein
MKNTRKMSQTDSSSARMAGMFDVSRGEADGDERPKQFFSPFGDVTPGSVYSIDDHPRLEEPCVATGCGCAMLIRLPQHRMAEDGRCPSFARFRSSYSRDDDGFDRPDHFLTGSYGLFAQTVHLEL